MTAQQLKNSILQMAVQGKLVPQDPNDEPASVLLERIRAEKEQLIKQKKIKKEKNPSYIFRGADNTPYEKIGNNEPVSIADEVPFEIPDSWEWARLGQIVFNRGQCTPQEKFCYIDIGSINNKQQCLNSEETVLSADKAPSRARKLVAIGDILYSTVRPYLHNMCIIDRSFSRIPIASTGFAVMTCHSDFYSKYLFYYLMSPDFDAYANDTDNAKFFLRGTLSTVEHYLSKPSPFPTIRNLKWHLISDADWLIIADFLIRSIIRRWTLSLRGRSI